MSCAAITTVVVLGETGLWGILALASAVRSPGLHLPISRRIAWPSRAQLTAQSDAERTLNKIKKILRHRREVVVHPGQEQDELGNAAQPAAGHPGQDQLCRRLGRQDSEAEYDMSPIDLSNSFLNTPSPPSSTTAAILKRLKENILPSRTKSADQVQAKRLPHLPHCTFSSLVAARRKRPEQRRLAWVAVPMFRGSRTGTLALVRYPARSILQGFRERPTTPPVLGVTCPLRFVDGRHKSTIRDVAI